MGVAELEWCVDTVWTDMLAGEGVREREGEEAGSLHLGLIVV